MAGQDFGVCKLLLLLQQNDGSVLLYSVSRAEASRVVLAQLLRSSMLCCGGRIA
jgi:hypothetical protein